MNVFFITSWLLFIVDQPEFGNGAFGGGGPMFKASPMMDTAAARAVGGANVGEPTGQIRKEFPETWIMTSSMAKYE